MNNLIILGRGVSLNKLMNIENKKDKLNKLQNKLVTRNRLIEHTDKAIENKNKKINIIKKIYILFIVFLFITLRAMLDL